MVEIAISFIIIIISLILYLTLKTINKYKKYEKLSEYSFNDNPLKILKEEDQVSCFLCLKNNDFLSGQMNGTISLYNHKDLSILCLIKVHCEIVTSLSELNDNTILTSSVDGTLTKIRLLIKDNNNNIIKNRKKDYIVEFVFYTSNTAILKGVQLRNSDDILSCNFNKELILWKKTDKNELELYKPNKILLKDEFVFDIMQINEQLFITVGNSLQCWDVKKYESITKFKYSCRSNSIYKLNEDLIGVFLEKSTNILIFNTKELNVVKIIKLSKFALTSLLSLTNNIVIAGIYDEENQTSFINQYILKVDKLQKENKEIIDYKNLEMIKIKSEQVSFRENDQYFEDFSWERITIMEEMDNFIVLGTGGKAIMENIGKLIIFKKK